MSNNDANTQKALGFLEKSDNNFITLTRVDSNRKIGPEKVFLNDIPNADLYNYILGLLGNIAEATKVYVEVRKKNGTSSLKIGSFNIEFSPTAQVPQLLGQPQTQAIEAVPIPAPAPASATPDIAKMFGLGLPEVLSMQRDSDRLEDMKEKYDDLKEDHRELKRKYEALDDEHRALKTKDSAAEKEKELAIKEVKNDVKGFFDSPAFEKMMDKAPEILAGMASMKSGAAAGALGNPNISEAKKQYIGYVSDILTDDQVDYMAKIVAKMPNQAFNNELTILINKYV